MDVYLFESYLNKMHNLSNMVYENRFKEIDLSLLEVKLLSQIKRYGVEHKITTTFLAQLNSVSLAAIMHKLDVLIEKGYIYREVFQDDQRIKFYFLTEKGINVCQEVDGFMKSYSKSILACIGEDVNKFEEILKKIINFMEVEVRA